MAPDIETLRHRLRTELPRLRAEYDVESLYVFGSRVRGDNSPESDLDILVTFIRMPGLMRFVGLEMHLSDLLGVKVDLVLRESLRRRIGERILAEAVPV